MAIDFILLSRRRSTLIIASKSIAANIIETASTKLGIDDHLRWIKQKSGYKMSFERTSRQVSNLAVAPHLISKVSVAHFDS